MLIRILLLNFFKKKREFVIYFAFLFLYFFRIFLSKAAQLRSTYKVDVFMNSIIDRSQYRRNLIHRFFITTSYLLHNFSKRLKNLMILCSLKCNVSENFEININIMYLTAKNVAIEKKKIKVVIFKDLMNESIFKLSDSEMIIISIKIV